MMLQYPAQPLLEPRKYITCQTTLLQVFEDAPAEAYVICTESYTFEEGYNAVRRTLYNHVADEEEPQQSLLL
jgi:hypothetical protein